MTDDDLRAALVVYAGEVKPEDYEHLPDHERRRFQACHHIFTRLLELLPPADDGPPFDAWGFIRDVLSRGVNIEHDSRALGSTYEQLSARLDAAARELADRLKPHMKPTEPKS
jgi:hypothetical protein